jgi:dTDP-4-amino-4,6-dideoxygalactose transaminase
MLIYFAQTQTQLQLLTVARALGDTFMIFLVHPTLTQAEVDRTCEVVRRVMVSDDA